MGDPAHVHFIGIGGTGMGSLAGLLRARGLRVTGSDEGLYPPMSVALERWGIVAEKGFRPEHVLAEPPDLVVIGNVVRPDNAEARAALDAGLPHLSFPHALRQLAMQGRHAVVVAGTHGKTTVTSLVATLLLETGRDPSLLVGGIAENFGGSYRDGGGEHFVVEGDEYDTAFFDKTPKFWHYGADTLVLTSVEFDHADIYRDLEDVKRVFREGVARLGPEATLVAAVDAPAVCEVAAGARCRVVGYGLAPEPALRLGLAAHWRAEGLVSGSAGTRFAVLRDGRRVGSAEAPLHGRHNVANALGALATVAALGVAPDQALAALGAFRGVKRRQEVRGEARGVLVVDDFAHHPTAVRETLRALRERFPGRRLVAAFEPRTNTSRRAIFQADYVDALAVAARVLVACVPEGPLYSATGEVRERLSVERLADDLRARGVAAEALPDADAVVEDLVRHHEPGDVVAVMSNGPFGGVWEKLLERLRALERD